MDTLPSNRSVLVVPNIRTAASIFPLVTLQYGGLPPVLDSVVVLLPVVDVVPAVGLPVVSVNDVDGVASVVTSGGAVVDDVDVDAGVDDVDLGAGVDGVVLGRGGVVVWAGTVGSVFLPEMGSTSQGMAVTCSNWAIIRLK